jgi:hypothetical protein
MMFGKGALAITSLMACVAFAPSAAAAEPSSISKNGDRGAGGETRERTPDEHFRIGPLVGVGFPRPFAIEGLAKIERLVGVGFEYSFLPRMSVFNADTGFKAFAVDLRVFPFRGAFFIGVRTGRQWLDAKATLTAGQFGEFTESMAAATWFFNPRAGVLYTFQSGITLGIDAGVQVPINPSYERQGRATEAGLASQFDIDGTLMSIANALGNRTTPTVDLLRLGFLF